MPVTDKHPEYDKHYSDWKLMRVSLDGESDIKAGRDEYLPMPSGMKEAEKKDPSGNSYLYNGYLTRAKYEQWVSDSLRSMVGLVSRLKPDVKLPKQMEGIIENATDDGFSLNQLFLRVVRQSLAFGRTPLLVNIDGKQRPYIVAYEPESAINWKFGMSPDGRRDLALAVFAETRADNERDEFSHDVKTVYRVFAVRNGECVTYVVDDKGDIQEQEATLKTGDSNKPALDYIPVVYCGSTDNSPDVDELPLLSMARNAIKHYQLGADYFTALHYTSHPQPWVSGLDEEAELSVTGPSAAWDLGKEGTCGYLEFQGAGIDAVRIAMTDQKAAALESGARVMDVGAQESGDARRARQDDQYATLHSVVMTAAAAIEQCLRYGAEWLGLNPDEVSFTVKPDFATGAIDPVMAKELKEAALSGFISVATYWQYITTGKLPEHGYDEEAVRAEFQQMGGMNE